MEERRTLVKSSMAESKLPAVKAALPAFLSSCALLMFCHTEKWRAIEREIGTRRCGS